MKFTFELRHQMSFLAAMVLIILDSFIFFGTVWYFPFLIISATVGSSQYWIDIIKESRRQSDLEDQFPEFVRNFVSAIKSGIPAAKAVIHVSEIDYGELSPHIKKLAHQLQWSVPFHRAFIKMGEDTGNRIIKRSILSVVEAEQYGGNIEDVLSTITDSLIQIKKIKAQRESSIHSQVVQNYIIFLVFLAVLVIIQNLLVPYVLGMGINDVGLPVLRQENIAQSPVQIKVSIDFSSPRLFMSTILQWFVSLNGIFLMLAVIQSIFAGLVIGKLSEASFSAGIKHSLILFTISVFVIVLTQGAIK